MTKDLYKNRVLRLKALVDEAGGQVNFARQYSQPGADQPIDTTYLSQILNGYRPFGEKSALNMARRAGLPERYFLDEPNVSESELRTAAYEIPILSASQVAQFFVENSSCELHKFGVPLLSDFCKADDVMLTSIDMGPNSFAMNVQGDAMSPEFPQGTRVLCDPNLEPKSGDYVVVCQTPAEPYYRQLVQDGTYWYLRPANPQFPTRELSNLDQIIGVVRGTSRTFR